MGDLYVRANVQIPKKLNERQKKILRDFEDKIRSKDKETTFSSRMTLLSYFREEQETALFLLQWGNGLWV